MIWAGILTSIYAILQIFLQIFPFANTNTVNSINTSVSQVRNSIASAGWIFPIDTFFTLLTAVIVIETSIITFKVVRWIASNITLGFIK